MSTTDEDDFDLKTMKQVVSCGFEPIERKGRGAYGYVYEVGDAEGNPFAFKYILPDINYELNGLDSINEIDILARVKHPHIIHANKIITPKDCNIDGIAIILPLAERTLDDLRADLRITKTHRIRILYQLATGMAFLHASNILHLDIKTHNVVIKDIKENIPYLIDFGLSMVVDDIAVGKYNKHVRVTLDFRPPEILNGGRIYNGAVDVWSFGILALYFLSDRAIYPSKFVKMDEKDFAGLVESKFATSEHIETLLRSTMGNNVELISDLIFKMLQIDPSKRLTAQQICDHPLFDSVRTPIPGSLKNPLIPFDYADDHRNILKIMVFQWAKEIYPNEKAELLFLAVDLFNRTGSYYKNKDPKDRLQLAATCLWMASKLTDVKLINLSLYVPMLHNMAPAITNNDILSTEIEIIHILGGILQVSNLYSQAKSNEELKFSFEMIIINKDSTIYARTDTPLWYIAVRNSLQDYKPSAKDITIAELV